MTPSPQQASVIEFVRSGRGSAFVEAVAGAGKTTTLIKALAETSGYVSFAAYNKKIADEINEKIRDMQNPDSKNYDRKLAGRGNQIRVGTFHSFGFGAWRRAYPQVKVSKDDQKSKEMFETLQIEKPLQAFVAKLVGLAKQRAIGLFGSVQDDSLWYGIIDHFDLAFEIEDEKMIERGVMLAKQGLQWHRDRAPELIDFDDMIYMPLVSNVRFFQVDWVFVDEAQDTNPARRALARKMLKPNGRAAFVGDRHQAIYGFCHPAGTKVLTPKGYKNIETLKVGDEYVSVNTSGDVAGWQGSYKIEAVTQHKGWNWLLEVGVADKKVRVTPHHRLPVKVDDTALYVTYMMRRQGKYRVGFMSMYANAGKNEKRFMLSQRSAMEGADAAWILMSHATKYDAIIHETSLHKRGAFGGSFTYLTSEEIDALPQDAMFYHKLLQDHGRLSDFPLWVKGKRQHFERNVPFITEACNIVPGMRVQVLGSWDDRKRGRSRHTGKWHPASITKLSYSSEMPTYGITVRPLSERSGYSSWSLYVADGVIVHNTGADNDAIDHIIRDFGCQTLPLTVTFRCPKSVVAEARQIVSHIEAHETAPEGIVSSMMEKELYKLDNLTPADAILCRNTKPLVQTAYSLIKRGIACHVEGRDIGMGLLKLVNRFAARSLNDLLDKLTVYGEEQSQKLIAKGRETQAEALRDRIETILVIAEGCADADCVRTKIMNLFQDSEHERKPTLTLSTVHRSKGREWQRVFIMGREMYMPSPYARQPWQQEQEANLQYVAITRSQNELIYVAMEPKK